VHGKGINDDSKGALPFFQMINLELKDAVGGLNKLNNN
jgi:hypothetical protein